jgi:transcriptional regulator with XRE-family HTH domain
MSQPELGMRLRAVRRAHGLTLAQVASLSGLSKSFVSMLENGRTNVSATRLQRLAAVFGLKTTDFLPDEASRALVQVVRTGEGARLHGFADGIEARVLGGDRPRRLQPVRLTLPPGAAQRNPTGHAGEEFLFVLAGRVLVAVDGGPPVALEAGDSAYYPSALAHDYVNEDDAEAVLLTISAPNSYFAG